jgi:uncharacterized protein involved in exopolysaccharide biosynthesis
VGSKIIQLLLSAFIISLFLGIGWNMVRGFIDGFIDGRENNEYNDKRDK